MFGRRDLLKMGSAAALGGLPSSARLRDGLQQALDAAICRADATEALAEKPDYTLDIRNTVVELGKETAVSTRTYNGSFPGPLLRFREGKTFTVDVHNRTVTPEQLHWHGQFVPAEIDGASEEGSPFIPPGGTRRIRFTPMPAGFRFYHTHVMAESDLSLGLYSGLAGPVYVEPKSEPGAYDREVFLTLKEFGPYFNRMEMKTGFLAPKNPQRSPLNDRNCGFVRQLQLEADIYAAQL